MARGGKRPGAGRPPGAKSRPLPESARWPKDLGKLYPKLITMLTRWAAGELRPRPEDIKLLTFLLEHAVGRPPERPRRRGTERVARVKLEYGRGEAAQ